MTIQPQVEKLIRRGVRFPDPESVYVGEEVEIERISGDGVTIWPGCRISGRSTLILQGASLGAEGPITAESCQIGPSVSLRGGYFKKAVFLEKASAGSGAHVREGTILEEEAGIAHTVGLKQTILLPFVTLGSLINFCDCLMSGGTSRKDHSEVGSAYIHFNYTPNQDKATASLLGDVPRGVMLRQRPIFLGGQGGLVGPCRLEFGTVIAAGSVYRKDELRPDRLLIAGGGRNGNIPFSGGIYQNVRRILENNFIYLGNLIALMQWYEQVRSRFISAAFPEALLEGLKEKLNLAIDERIRRLGGLAEKMPGSVEKYREIAGEKAAPKLILRKQEFHGRWAELSAFFETARGRAGEAELRDEFLKRISAGIRENGRAYIPVIKGLTPEDADIGTRWLQGITESVTRDAFQLLPAFGTDRSE
ncbi:UDP-N-acetylglucosamine pyrophosphorylase [Desulfonema ishimotonii]|uniref:UDP-N-acetylglucosamine pyrophosphorylase n=1 Tax=Desulfonema ishimotonii TaxID=45657 RepID=A0A401FUN9_9BACT|nr:hypothetical protein [Desulfonema ishimotonii]GBC60679.1 UDP-N-acetylglucosamine pyrophosphorylase [Desulfonema ishimotonii]